MKVEEGKLVTLEYKITTAQGELIETSMGTLKPLTFVFGKGCGLPSGVTESLEGLEENEEKVFDVPPEKFFGTFDSLPTMKLPKKSFPEDANIKVGGSFEGSLPNSDQTVKFVVTENLADEVVVRLIPQHFGKTIHIEAKILEVTEALLEEEDEE